MDVLNETPTPDVAWLRKAVSWVEAEAVKPEAEREWDQAEWRTLAETRQWRLNNPACGTAFRVAGWVTEQTVGFRADSEVVAADGRVAAQVGREVLGLTYTQASRLFYDSNTAADVRRIAEDIAGEPL